MATNPEVVEDTSAIVTYRLNDKPSLPVTTLLGLQHTLAMFVGNITPPIIVAAALGFDVMTTAFVISMTLFTAGLSTWIQAKKIGPIGSGMCVVQGTSFLFIPLAIQAGQIGGWPLVLGMALATSPVEMILSRFMDQARKIFAPVVIGSFLTCSGLILMSAGMASLCGGYGAEDFGNPRYIALGIFVLVLIVIFNRFAKGLLQTASIAIAIAAGYLVSIPMGLVDFSAVSEAGWFMAPFPSSLV